MAKLLQLAILILIAYWFGRRFLRSLNPSETDPPANTTASTEPLDPHTILDVKPGVTSEELRRAYQTQIRKYHPDFLENMAPELRTLAEQRTKEINRAYETLRRLING